YRMEDSFRRQKELERQQGEDLDVYDAFRLLNDEDHEIFSTKYDASAGTIHTSAYVPIQRKVFFAIGANRMPVIFDFNRYLEVEKIKIKQIKGILNYDTPFINVE